LPLYIEIILLVVAAAASGVIMFFLGINHRKKQAESEIGSAEQEAKRIVDEATETAEAKKKEAILKVKMKSTD
jgi:ribonuclease Y